ncbi:MAG: phosphoribosylformylglycinamidine synthase subunit PurL [Methanosarcinales archaeon]|uniref:Phosphoribosylformylglycinamidine synthase subunit PurL n=1 Tax=Candidatus Ethanoperedens thermophilum TaxID=2766897 RepID=A0A848DBD1_9EURY|nr:phosphoribosylformylglycinamidine synthase subunit PurL [Candidatus Ethanoperedens thermophilum]
MLIPESDFKLISEKMGREPNTVEQGCFLNLWSEHCSYRSSGLLLKTLPTTGEDVIIGPGDDAAIVKLTDTLYLAIGMESHNHPSYVDPYNGAATGIGGIVRDIVSMGARPIALMDALYFGSPEIKKNQYLLEHVVRGIAGYGNCIGVPVVGGEVMFHNDYSGNPLVNVVCVGLLSKQHLITATAQHAGNSIILIGASTGRDGLGGASFASKDLSSESESERSSVQIGDPYTEKLLIEATLEAVHNGVVESCRDLGAAGLAGATSEMAAKGNLGMAIDLDQMPLREESMTPFEIMISESQERMVLEVKPENVGKVLLIADKYDLNASVIAKLTTTPNYTVHYNGEIVADIPIHLLSGGAPYTEQASIAPLKTSDISPPEIETGNLKGAILSVVSSPNIASKQWIYSQYDHEVQIQTVIKPGADSGLIRITPGVAIALSSGCNPLHTFHDPYTGTYGAVVENAMNLATIGAEPLCIVDCLNFGNPETKETYYQFKQAVIGLGDASKKLHTPVVGGNVSFYNESKEHNTTILPTPSLGMIGKLTNVEIEHLPHSTIQHKGETIILIGESKPELRGSEYYHILNTKAGSVPTVPENIEQILSSIRGLVQTGSVTTAHDISNGGLAAALCELITPTHGAEITLTTDKLTDTELLFSETYGRMIITTPEQTLDQLQNIPHTIIGTTTRKQELHIITNTEEITLQYKEIRQAAETLTKIMKE